MATRSNIIVHLANGRFKSVYCHNDGYPAHHMPILTGHYATQDLAEELVRHGDISVLAESCEKPAGHSFDTPVSGHTIYYGRDRGESGCNGWLSDTIEEAKGDNGLDYYFINGTWLHNPTKAKLNAALDGAPAPVVHEYEAMF